MGFELLRWIEKFLSSLLLHLRHAEMLRTRALVVIERIGEKEAIREEEEEHDEAENRGENDDPQIMIALHLSDSLKT